MTSSGLRRTSLFVAIAALCVGPATHAAPGDPVGAPIRVNATVPGLQEEPDVAQNARGDRVVAWADVLHVYARRIARDGTLIGPEILVDSAGNGAGAHHASVAINASGRFAVAWDGGGRSHLRSFAPDGTPLGPAVAVDPRPNTPAVALDDDGDAVVAWSEDAGAAPDVVYVRRFAADGTPKGPPARVSHETGGSHSHPSVACDPDGDFTVAWTSYGAAGHVVGSGYFILGGLAGSGSRVWMRRFDEAGAPAGPAKVVATATVSQVLLYPGVRVANGRDIVATHLDLAMNRHGEVAIAWAEGGEGAQSDRIRVRRYGASGLSAWQTVVATNLSRNSALFYPSVSLNDAGDTVVAWEQVNSGLWYRRYDAEGTPRAAKRRIPGTDLIPGSPEVTVNDDGTFAIYWDSRTPNFEDGFEIFGQEFEGP